MLQVASVVGDSVPIGILHAIYPIESTEESLERDLNFLQQAAFVRRSDRPGYFQFCQVILPCRHAPPATCSIPTI